MIIGITGSFGSGKTTVAKMFGREGAYVIDADKVYHSLIAPGARCHKKIVRYFGKEILTGSSRIDRKKLGKIVFKDTSKLKRLNIMTHFEVIKEIKRIAKSIKGKDIVIEASLLIESGFYKNMDKIILVANKKREQVKRIKENKGMSGKDILERMKAQIPFKKKLVFADFIIDNSGSKTNTLIQVRKIWKQRGA